MAPAARHPSVGTVRTQFLTFASAARPHRLHCGETLGPITLVRTGQGSAGTYRGILLRRHPNGDIDLETRPGIIVTIPAGEIQSVSALDPRETRQ